MLHRRWFPDHLDGELVVLRRHTRDNLRDFLRWYQDPEVARLTRYQDGPMRPEEIERFFAMRAMGPESLAMGIHIRTDNRLIGSCAFSQLDADNGSTLFHITIGEHDAWGHGYGSEATRLMVDHAFGSLGLHRVALTVFAFNERAIRAYQRVGFETEGSAREAIWRDGRWWDELHMSVLEPDWRAARWQARAVADGRVGAAAVADQGSAVEGSAVDGRATAIQGLAAIRQGSEVDGRATAIQGLAAIRQGSEVDGRGNADEGTAAIRQVRG